MVRGHALEGALLGGEVIAEGETEDRLEGVLHLARSGCPHEVAEPYINGLSSWSHGRIQRASDLLFSIFYQVSGWTPYLLQENAEKAQQQREIAEAIQRGKAGWQASPAMVGERLLLSLIRAGDRKGALAAIPDEVVDELIVHGTPEECRAHIQRYVDNGVDTPAIAILPLGVDARQACRDLALQS